MRSCTNPVIRGVEAFGGGGRCNSGDEEEHKMNGETINAYYNEGTGVRRLPGRIFHVPLPATYEVSSSLNLRFILRARLKLP